MRTAVRLQSPFTVGVKSGRPFFTKFSGNLE